MLAAEAVPDRAASHYESARSAYVDGRLEEALGLIESALTVRPPPRLRAALQHLRGRVETSLYRPLFAYELLITEAAAIEGLDDSLAAEMLADAAHAALLGNEQDAALAIARRAHRLAAGRGGPSEAAASGALGLALVLAGEADAGERLALASPDDLADGATLDHPRHGAGILFWLEKYDLARQVLDRVIELARTDARRVLPGLLDTLAALDYRTGRWNAAEARSAEALRLARELGLAAQEASCLTTLGRVAAARSRQAESRSRIAEALELARPGDLNFAWAVSVAGLLELGLGRADAAADELEKLGRVPGVIREPTVVAWLPDLVEAHARSGRMKPAERHLDMLEEQAARTRRVSTLAATARCRGLLAAPAEFALCFEEALSEHAKVPTPFERARTELCYGERLRRARRRADAGVQLQSALATFEQLGAQGWAAQARRELAASRGRRARAQELRTRLTPRELQVAALVQHGLTNREVAVRLFVTEKAIEYHLGNIYTKLGIRSRTELARVSTEQTLP